MKFYLLLIILLFGAWTLKRRPTFDETLLSNANTQIEKKELISETERTTIIVGLEKGDYTVLDRFFETNKLYPYIIATNGSVVLFDIENSKCIGAGDSTLITNDFTISNIGGVISYTNAYGIPFLNPNEVIVSQEEWNTIGSKATIHFETLVNVIFPLSDLSEILYTFDKCNKTFSDISLTYYLMNVLSALDTYFVNSINDFDDKVKIRNLISFNAKNEDRSNINKPLINYLSTKVFFINNEKQHVNSIKNYFAYYFFFNSYFNGLFLLTDFSH
ncbi:MAG: hypothetical protein ACRCV0_07915 [Brevinema sp.]